MQWKEMTFLTGHQGQFRPGPVFHRCIKVGMPAESPVHEHRLSLNSLFVSVLDGYSLADLSFFA
jgi:hypothetical protein